jgi:hypothetical protein
MNCEHSWADALVIAHLWETAVCSRSSLDRFGGYTPDGTCAPVPTGTITPTNIHWKRLEFDTRHSGLSETIVEAYKSAYGLLFSGRNLRSRRILIGSHA